MSSGSRRWPALDVEAAPGAGAFERQLADGANGADARQRSHLALHVLAERGPQRWPVEVRLRQRDAQQENVPRIEAGVDRTQAARRS